MDSPAAHQSVAADYVRTQQVGKYCSIFVKTSVLYVKPAPAPVLTPTNTPTKHPRQSPGDNDDSELVKRRKKTKKE
eukprot:4172019-Ditylum_brightwellii.AAC.1